MELRCTYDPASRGGDSPDGRKVKATLHWVSAAHAVPAEVRIYDHLFSRPDPGAEGDVLDDINPRSLEVLSGCRLEPALAETATGETVQFERQGYFCPDTDSKAGPTGLQPHHRSARHLGEGPGQGPAKATALNRARSCLRNSAMKIVCAPNAFKGCLAASEAADAMAAGARRAVTDADVVAFRWRMAATDWWMSLSRASAASPAPSAFAGPRNEPLEATFCYAPALDFAAVEMALASGLALLAENRRDPILTTTRGTGELIRAALDLGVSRIGVGIGGSATNDGGIGMAAALGVRFLDDRQRPVEPVGGELGRIRGIDMTGLDRRVAAVRIEAVCDVDNPLCGSSGAAHVYGPQKGASPEQVEALDAGLANLADVIEKELGIDVRDLPGSGAAGGLGAGLRAFLDAELRRGVDLVLELVDLDGKLDGADLVLTGEGQIDCQTARGKAPAGVGAAARARGVPCIAIAGSIGEGLGELHDVGIDAVFSLCPGPVTLEDAMTRAAEYLARATEQAVRVFLARPRPVD